MTSSVIPMISLSARLLHYSSFKFKGLPSTINKEYRLALKDKTKKLQNVCSWFQSLTAYLDKVANIDANAVEILSLPACHFEYPSLCVILAQTHLPKHDVPSFRS